MTRSNKTAASWGLTMVALAAACAGEGPAPRRAGEARVERLTPAADRTEAILVRWPAVSREAARRVVRQYGPPDEATASMLLWHRNGPWKRTIVTRDPVRHDWPRPHQDMVEQVVDYRVPPERFSDLAQFDGSIIVERTRGEVSARCGGEPMNFLALNLMDDVVTGRRTVEQARRFYEETAEAFGNGSRSPYTLALRFEHGAGRTADPDRSAIAASGRGTTHMGE